MQQLDMSPSDKSTSASSSNSLDDDAALLSTTLVRVHQHVDGWHTGNWEEPSNEGLFVARTPKSRFSLYTMTACCGNDTILDETKDGERFSRYKISRRRNSLRVPKFDIECMLREEGRDDDPVCVRPEQIDKRFSKSFTHRIQHFPPPVEWIHAPLLLTATPGSGTVIRRIKRVCDAESDNSDCLGPHAQLPINNGREVHSLLIDFETPSFEGTALFRIRNSSGTDENDIMSTSFGIKKGGNDYFAPHNRKFQMVIQGKFRRPNVIMADCMSGMVLDHPLRTTGSPVTDLNPSKSSIVSSKKSPRKKKNKEEGLPPKWVLRASVKIAGLFSPRIDANLKCSHPRILAPLCSIAQSIHVSRKGQTCPVLDVPHIEPNHQSTESLIHDLKCTQNETSSNSSVPIRKKRFDSVYDARLSHPHLASPCFDTDSTYTFEFLQHLIDYNNFSLDFGSILGKMKLGGAFKGQPCRLVAGVMSRSGQGKEVMLRDMDCLWSFDLWHESLLVQRDGVVM